MIEEGKLVDKLTQEDINALIPYFKILLEIDRRVKK